MTVMTRIKPSRPGYYHLRKSPNGKIIVVRAILDENGNLVLTDDPRIRVSSLPDDLEWCGPVEHPDDIL